MSEKIRKMKKTPFGFCFLFMLTYLNLAAQYDTAMFQFKRQIIATVSEKVDSVIGFDTSKNTVHFEFSNFEGHDYIVGNPNSTVGFYLFRQDTSDWFPYNKPARYSGNVKFLLARKSDFEFFLTSDEFYSVDLHKNRTWARIIDDPVEGWMISESFFFRYNADYFRPPERPTYHLILTIPVYTFDDRKLESSCLVRVELSGIKKDDIQIVEIKHTLF